MRTSHPLLISRNLRRGLLLGLVLGIWSVVVAPNAASAAVTTTGQVIPAPPAGGGNLAGAFFVGDTLTGTLTINGGTPLNLTSGSATVGNTATGLGIVALTGLGSNWSTTGTNDLTIGNAGAGSVSVANLAQIVIGDDLFVAVTDGSSGSLILSDFGTVVDANDVVQVGQGGDGTIEVLAGARLFADDTIIAQTSSGRGRVTISGAQTLWRQPNAMTVADLGLGVLEVLDGGRLETLNMVAGNGATSNGTMEVRGAGSYWDLTGFMTLGVQGSSTLRVRDGGRLTNTSSARLATQTGSESHAEVSGAQSLWSVGTTLTVGDFGFGTLEILDGGRVTSTDVRLGDNTGARGEATVDGEGSTWEITGTIDVSDPAEGGLTISNGGLVTTTGVARVNAAGTLVLDGGRLTVLTTSGTTNQGLIQGGGTITGLVTNTASGEIRVEASDDLVLGNNLTNQGLINLDGGEMEVLGLATNTLDIDVRDGVLRFQTAFSNNSSGQLAFVGGDSDVFGPVTNAVNAEIAVGGTASVVFHDTVTNNGTIFIQPGGEVFMLENLGFGGGSALQIQLQEIDLIDPDTELSDALGQVQVGGSATLAGTLEVDLVGGYMPTLGESFQIVTAGGGRSGFFASEILPALAGGLGWDVQYNPNSVVLSVVGTGVAGDYNDDGIVDAADYVVWRKNAGTMNTLPNDPNGGTIGTAQYNTWRANFGQTLGGGSATNANAAVPEPATFLLLMFGVAGLCLRRRRAA